MHRGGKRKALVHGVCRRGFSPGERSQQDKKKKDGFCKPRGTLGGKNIPKRPIRQLGGLGEQSNWQVQRERRFSCKTGLRHVIRELSKGNRK